MISAENITKIYKGLKAIDNISLKIADGEIYGIAGLNGAGKSTLISILAGVVRPNFGNVLYNDVDIFSKRKNAAIKIGYVPQEIALFPELSVLDNLKFWSAASNSVQKRILSQAYLESLFEHISLIAGLKSILSKKVSTLSGGMKRRVNISAALCSDPDILIMDEPTAGLDVKNRRDIINFVTDLVKNSNRFTNKKMTVIYTSHQSGELEQICDKILLIHNGKKILESPTNELFNHFSQSYLSSDLQTNLNKMTTIDDILYNIDRLL